MRALAAAAVLASAAPAGAGQQVAIVEAVSGDASGLGVMDYVETGQRISLAPGASLTLGYLRSCIREVIRGGAVVVGETQSQVEGATSVRRDKVDCDGARLELTAEQRGKSGVVVFRAPSEPGKAAELPEPELTLYGLSPLVDLGGASRLTVERLDRPGERYEFEAASADARRGSIVDFAKVGRALAPGGLYRAAAGERDVVFRVDPFAVPGAAPLAGRLIRF